MNYRSTTQTVSWFSLRAQDDSLIIRPSFQRRPVWTDKQKSNLVESILLELPIPEIYLYTQVEPDGNTQYVVVDGQQRITSVLEFLGVGAYGLFELSGLSDASRWEGYSFSDLADGERASFYGYALGVRELLTATEEEVKGLFIRFNKYLTPLNPQELRNATYGGPFIQLAEVLADDSYWAENRIVDPKSIRRMRDIEFASDLLLGVMHGPQSGNAKTLDEFYELYEIEDRFPEPIKTKRNFTRTLNAIQIIIPDLRDTRWSNRSDFYSLFVALNSLLNGEPLDLAKADAARQELDAFADQVRAVQVSERPGRELQGPPLAVQYVEAIRRGSSDKTRRAARHRSLTETLSHVFE